MAESLRLMGKIRTAILNDAPAGVSVEAEDSINFKFTRTLARAWGMLVLAVFKNKNVGRARDHLAEINFSMTEKYGTLEPTAHHLDQRHDLSGIYSSGAQQDIADLWGKDVRILYWGIFFDQHYDLMKARPGKFNSRKVGVFAPLSWDFLVANALNEYGIDRQGVFSRWSADVQPVCVSTWTSADRKVVFPRGVGGNAVHGDKNEIFIIDKRPDPPGDLMAVFKAAKETFSGARIRCAFEDPKYY